MVSETIALPYLFLCAVNQVFLFQHSEGQH